MASLGNLMVNADGAPLLQYFHDVTYGVLQQSGATRAGGSTITLPDAISGGPANGTSLTFKNFRGADLPFSVAKTDSGSQRPGDFAVASDCPALPLTPTLGANVAASAVAGSGGVLAPGTCTLSVSFQPLDDTSDAVRQATLTLDVTPANGLDPLPVSFTISGTATAALSVTATPAPFVTLPSVAQEKSLKVTDTLGDAFHLCADTAAAAFNFPGDYALPTLAPDGAGCSRVPAALPGTLPRTVDITVRFTPSDIGPRNATFNMRRLDGSGTPVGRTYAVHLLGNQGAFVQVEPSTLFQDVSVEETGHVAVDRSVTVYSRGTAPVTLNGAAFGGGQSADYTLVAGGCTLLASLPAYTDGGADQQCAYTVRFDPSDVGSRTAQLTVMTGGANPTVALLGTGQRAPRLVVTEGSSPIAANTTLDFGSQTLGGIYPLRVLTLANVGTTGALETRLAGGLPTAFTAATDANCSSLAATSTCQLTVRFDAAIVQAYSGTLTVQSRPAGAPAWSDFPLSLTGSGETAQIPALAWQDSDHHPISSVEFGGVDAGGSHTVNLLVHNPGAGGVQVKLLNATGLDATQFAIAASPNCQPLQDLYEGADCQVSVTFAPASAGAKSASLQLVSTGSSLAPIALHGNGVAGSGSVLTVSATSLSFSSTQVGTQSQALRVTLANQGSAGITVQRMDITGSFAITGGSCGATPLVLPAGGQCDVTLAFQPSAEGPASGRVRIQSDASTAPSDVALDGNGAPAPDLSGGGCSLARHGDPIDPTLWVLMLGALAVLERRRRARRPPPRESA